LETAFPVIPQLYEIVFLLGLLAVLKILSRPIWESGDLFKLYMMAYLTFRLFIDFIKPDFHPFWGLSAIQVACFLGQNCGVCASAKMRPGRAVSAYPSGGRAGRI